MKRLPFRKMQAQGNDFVILDARAQAVPDPDAQLISRLADRRYGIGCDQVLLLLPDSDCDAAMRIFNADASEAGNCGNGLRCVGSLLLEENATDSIRIRLRDRVVRIEKAGDGIRVHMGGAIVTDDSPAHVDVDIGNLHRVFFEAVEEFPTDCNIEIISGQVADDAWVDIIERGSGRTPACGSGACATAMAIWHKDGHQRPQHIHMPGGMVTVAGSPGDILLKGPVSFVYAGEFSL